MKIKNLKKASQKIKEAIKEQKEIMIFGDSDMDGVSSVVVLEEAIHSLGYKRKILVGFPDRNKEGYGINITALEYLRKKKKDKKTLLIVLDCGITNFDEIKKAKKYGFEVIVIDHHKVLDSLPEAEIIVDPKQKGDRSSFKEYCNAGLVFKLVEEMMAKNFSESLRSSFVELVGLATIADMMTESEENKIWIEECLRNISRTQRPGIQAFLVKLDERNFNSRRDFASKILSAFNTVKMKSHVIKTYELLTTNDLEEAKKMVNDLLKEAEERQREIRSLTENIKEEFLNNVSFGIIFKGAKNYRVEYLGAASSRLANYFNKPVFLYSQRGDISKGTVRVPKRYDAVKAMDSCKDLLITYGGHAPAAGFTIKNKNLAQFEQELIRYFASINE